MADDPTLAELQARCAAFSSERDWERFHSPRNLAMALSVEAGELLELFLWCADEGPQPLHPDRAPKVADEAADVLMCLLNFCERTGIDLAAALDDKLRRAALKYPVERVRGRALKYHEYDDYDPEAAD